MGPSLSARPKSGDQTPRPASARGKPLGRVHNPRTARAHLVVTTTSASARLCDRPHQRQQGRQPGQDGPRLLCASNQQSECRRVTFALRGGCRGKVCECWRVGAVVRTGARRAGGLAAPFSNPPRRSLSGCRCPRDGQAMASWCRWSLRRLWVAVRSRHSDLTADLPRRWKRSAPRLDLICPKTGSTVPWRLR
jgi:hypothetical protein